MTSLEALEAEHESLQAAHSIACRAYLNTTSSGKAIHEMVFRICCYLSKQIDSLAELRLNMLRSDPEKWLQMERMDNTDFEQDYGDSR